MQSDDSTSQGFWVRSSASVAPALVSRVSEDVLLVEFMYLVFTRMPGERMYLW